MELILVVVISAGMAENSQNGVSRSLKGATSGVASTCCRCACWATASLRSSTPSTATRRLPTTFATSSTWSATLSWAVCTRASWRSPTRLPTYKEYRNYVKRKIRAAKVSYYHTLITNSEPNNNWQIINQLANKINRTSDINELAYEGTTHTEPIEIAK